MNNSPGFAFEKTPNSIAIWILQRLNNDLSKLLYPEEALPNLYGGRLTPNFSNPAHQMVKPALVYVMQGINSTRKGYEFFTDMSDQNAIHVSRHGDYMGRLNIASGLDSSGYDAVVITSHNIFRNRKPTGLGSDQIFTKDLDRAIQKALDLFLPLSNSQRRAILRQASFTAFVQEKSLYADITSAISEVSHFIRNVKDNSPSEFCKNIIYMFLKANTPKSEDSWADDTVGVDFTKKFFEYMHGFDTDKFVKTVEHVEEAKRREKSQTLKGTYLQINKADMAYMATSKSCAEEEIKVLSFQSVAQIPNAYYEDYSVLKAAGVGNYVNGVGVQLTDNYWNEKYTFANTLFYLERDI
jgi:hypothetical protein